MQDFSHMFGANKKTGLSKAMYYYASNTGVLCACLGQLQAIETNHGSIGHNFVPANPEVI
jgi:hypothetical protein